MNDETQDVGADDLPGIENDETQELPAIKVPKKSTLDIDIKALTVLATLQMILLMGVLYMGYRLLDFEKQRIPRPVINISPHEMYAPVSRDMEKQTVRIWTPKGNGSGIPVADDLVVTNYHVIKGCEEGRTVWADITTEHGTERHAATIVTMDAARDLATLRIQGYKFEKIVELNDNPMEWGETVIMVGCPQGHMPVPTRGYYVRHANGKILVSCLGFWGNSGGPVFDANSGRLVGLCNETEQPKEIPGKLQQSPVFAGYLFYCVPASWIREHLQENAALISKQATE